MTRRLRILLLVVALAAGFSPVAVQACPGCRQASEEIAKEEPQTIQAGLALSWSVLFLLASVGGVMSFFGFYVSRTIKRLERERGS